MLQFFQEEKASLVQTLRRTVLGLLLFRTEWIKYQLLTLKITLTLKNCIFIPSVPVFSPSLELPTNHKLIFNIIKNVHGCVMWKKNKKINNVFEVQKCLYNQPQSQCLLIHKRFYHQKPEMSQISVIEMELWGHAVLKEEDWSIPCWAEKITGAPGWDDAKIERERS